MSIERREPTFLQFLAIPMLPAANPMTPFERSPLKRVELDVRYANRMAVRAWDWRKRFK
jgi:hypothetical protein